MTGAAPTGEIVRFPVRGMTCGSCVNRIVRAVERLDGVARVSVDLRHETATVRRDPGRVSNAVLAAAVEAAGYEAEVDAAQLLPPGSDRTFLERFTGR